MDTQQSTQRCNRACFTLALVWMLAVAAPSALRKPHVPDFAQYYLGGAMVLAGEPRALYPVPKPGAERNAGFAVASDLSPVCAALARDLGIEGYNRFVYPPPAAILFAPFALLSYGRALESWLLLMSLAGWGVARVAAAIHERLVGRPSRWSGAIALAVAGSPLMLHSIRSGNVSPAIALFLGLAVLDLLDDRGRAAGTWLALGGVFKGTSAALLPLAVARRRWAALVVLAAVAVGSVAGSVAILGLEPFRVFAAEIAPTHSRSDGSPTSQSLAALLLRCTGRSQLPAAWNAGIALLQLAVFLALALLVWTRRRLLATSPTHVAAAAAALLGCLLAFSPLVWAHYHLAGFLTLGWLLEEARRSHARALTALVPIVSLLFPLCLLAQAGIPLPPEPVGSHLLVGSLFTIGMAGEQLWRGARMGRSRRPTPARPRALGTPAALAPGTPGTKARSAVAGLAGLRRG